MLSDAVVAIVVEDQLDDILLILHRNHFGHVIRVVRAERCAPVQQLGRAGVPAQSAPVSVANASLLIFASAAARAPQFADLCLRGGATEAWIVQPNGFWTLVDDRILSFVPVRELEQQPAQHIPGRHDRTGAYATPIVSGSERLPPH